MTYDLGALHTKMVYFIIFTHIIGAEFAEILYKREVLKYFGAVCAFSANVSKHHILVILASSFTQHGGLYTAL